MTDQRSSEVAVKRTLVEEGTEFQGSFISTCPILVRGRVTGDVVAPSLEISLTGAVNGRVKVGQIRSQGELSGEIDADVVQLSGSVKDKTVVRAKSLEVKLGAAAGSRMQVVFGECELDVGDEPSREAAIAAARAAPALEPATPGAVSPFSGTPVAAVAGALVSSQPAARTSERGTPRTSLPAVLSTAPTAPHQELAAARAEAVVLAGDVEPSASDRGRPASPKPG